MSTAELGENRHSTLPSGISNQTDTYQVLLVIDIDGLALG